MRHIAYPITLLSTGFILLVGCSLFGWVFGPNFIQSKISEQIKLTRGSEVFEKWTNVPIPVYFKLYLFNVTNPNEIAKGEENPKFTEVGPFVYREKREKTDIRETEHGTLLYKEKITYFFEEAKSGGLSEADILTILNVPYVAMSQKISELPYPFDELASVYVASFKEKPFIHKTVGEILFKGWHLPLVAELEEYTGQQLMPNSTFGLFYGKNGTDDGELEVDAGLKGVNTFGNIISWRGKKKLDWWKEGSPCNEIRGTDGSIFPPFVTKKRVIEIFNAELCRSLFLTFNKEIEFFDIPSYRFTAPKEMLEDPRVNGSLNRCFCNEEDINLCLHTGTIDLSPCREGAPVAMSTPHFLDGFQEYMDKSGLVPSREEHQTFMDLEPTTGLVLRASKRIQINVQMKPVPKVRSLSRMPNMLFPVIWADESAEIDEEIANELKSKLLTPLLILEISKWIGVAFSLMIICIAFIMYSKFFKRKQTKSSSDADSASSSMLKSGSPVSNSAGEVSSDKITVPLIK